MMRQNNHIFKKNSFKIPIVSVISFICFLFIIPVVICSTCSCSVQKSIEKDLNKEENYLTQRNKMIKEQIIFRGIKDEKVLEAMKVVPRHEYVSKGYEDVAYSDQPLPIGMGQTISQPYIVALMTESLELDGDEKVLEIGTGSGYQAAVLAEIVNQVYTVEIIPELYQISKSRLLKYTNVTTSNHDGYYGWEEFAPYDCIIVTAAPDHIPQPLVEQLTHEGGIMVIPVGPPGWSQILWKVIKNGENVITEKISDVAFVPLTRSTE